MEMMMKILKTLGFKQTETDKRLMKLINETYDNTRVVGRGTLKISPSEVVKSSDFKKAQARAKKIVMASAAS